MRKPVATPGSAYPPPGAAGLFLPFRHRETERAFSGPRRARSRIARIPVIKPHTCVIKPEAIEGDIWRQVKGYEIGKYVKYSNITTHYHTLGVQWRGLTEV